MGHVPITFVLRIQDIALQLFSGALNTIVLAHASLNFRPKFFRDGYLISGSELPESSSK